MHICTHVYFISIIHNLLFVYFVWFYYIKFIDFLNFRFDSFTHTAITDYRLYRRTTLKTLIALPTLIDSQKIQA